MDVFKPMDGGIALTADEIKGRNTWNLWCGGNEQFWDRDGARELRTVRSAQDDRLAQARQALQGTGPDQPAGLSSRPPSRTNTASGSTKPSKPEPTEIDPKVFGRSDRHHGLSAVRQSRLQRRRREEVGCGASTTTTRNTRRERTWSGPTASAFPAARATSLSIRCNPPEDP